MTVKLTTLLVAGFFITACANNRSKYHDTSELEKPPQLEIVVSDVVSASASDNQDLEGRKPNTRLGQAVNLVADNLSITLPFEQAWKLVDLGLRLNKIEISDRNREKGQFYVVFDPDNAERKSNEEGGYFEGLFVDNNYPQGKYLLTLMESSLKNITVKIEFLESSDGHSSQDGYAEFKASDNGATKLLKRLYETLHDELPLD